MLGKLIKHEFRATAGYFGLICLGLIGFAGLSRLFILLEEAFGFFELPVMLSMLFYVIMAVAASVLTLVLIIKRFYSNIYGDEGYLTLTLPVERRKLIFSKLLVSAVWVIAVALATICSILILSLSEETIYMLSQLFAQLSYMFDYIFEYINISAVLLIIELVLMAVIELFNGILVFYASVSIGQLFSGHRMIGSVLGYLMISVVTNIISRVYIAAVGLTQRGSESYINSFIDGARLNGIMSFNLQVDIIMYIVLYAAMTAGLFALTNLIMKRAVNLH